MKINRVNLVQLALVAAATVGVAACDRPGSAGGPGATTGAKPPLYGQAEETFNVTTSSVTLKQGNTATGSFGIKRGANFDLDVAVTLDGLPTGVKVEPTRLAILSKSTDVKYTFTATDDVAPGEYVVKVIGHPTKGADATNQFKLTIAKKDSFTISMPFWTTALKQGESRPFTIAISRDKEFDQDVTLKIEGLSKGVTIGPTDALIKNGENEAKFVLKATDEAALGEFTAIVTGHPAKGADASHEFKYTVAKK